MAELLFNNFVGLVHQWQGKNKGAYAKKASGNDCPKVKPVEFMDMADTVDDVSRCVDDSVPASACNSKFVVHAAAELARHASVENGAKAAVKMDSPVAGLVAVAVSSGYGSDGTGKDAESADPDAEESSILVRMLSPPASPKLKRSCSNIETTTRSVPEESDLPSKSRSYNDLKALPPGRSAAPSGAADASPTASFRTSCSADRVMLKKRSSSQVLPSRSRKLWWRTFLWSHRNLHRPGARATVPTLPSAGKQGGAAQQHNGYTSDTLDTATADAKNKGVAVEEDPIPNQWVAFSAEASPLDRVSAWVNSLGNGSFHAVDDGDVTGHDGDGSARPQCSEIVELWTAGGKRHSQAKRRAADEAAQASSVVQTLNTFSSVAHIAGMGLRAVPVIAAFSTLRAVNLSGNMIGNS